MIILPFLDENSKEIENQFGESKQHVMKTNINKSFIKKNMKPEFLNSSSFLVITPLFLETNLKKKFTKVVSRYNMNKCLVGQAGENHLYMM